jgi:hypothetical protein
LLDSGCTRMYLDTCGGGESVWTQLMIYTRHEASNSAII